MMNANQQPRIFRFVQLCKERGLNAVINTEKGKVEVSGSDGKFLMSRPFSDFATDVPAAPVP